MQLNFNLTGILSVKTSVVSTRRVRFKTVRGLSFDGIEYLKVLRSLTVANQDTSKSLDHIACSNSCPYTSSHAVHWSIDDYRNIGEIVMRHADSMHARLRQLQKIPKKYKGLLKSSEGQSKQIISMLWVPLAQRMDFQYTSKRRCWTQRFSCLKS